MTKQYRIIEQDIDNDAICYVTQCYDPGIRDWYYLDSFPSREDALARLPVEETELTPFKKSWLDMFFDALYKAIK